MYGVRSTAICSEFSVNLLPSSVFMTDNRSVLRVLTESPCSGEQQFCPSEEGQYQPISYVASLLMMEGNCNGEGK